MTGSLLAQLREITVVVADTGDIRAIERVRPVDATTNPSLIVAAAGMPEYAPVVDEALSWARASAGAHATPAEVATLAADRLAVEFGRRILDLIPGRVSTEVDARLSYDTAATVERGRRLIGWYEAAGISRERVLIKIASTWEGIQAAEELERDGIHCNLTLLFGMSVARIYTYYKRFGYTTQVMGASFRNLGEILALAGCDLLTIAPNYLEELDRMSGELDRELDPLEAASADLKRIPMEQTDFIAAHAADEMATEKLAEGIASFSKAITGL